MALYLKAHPSILEKYLSKDEWNNVVYNEGFPKELRDELWQAINKKNKIKIVALTLKRFAVAASVIIMIAATYYIWPKSETVTKHLASVKIIPPYKHQTILNTTKKIMHFVLQDSSIVMLKPASSINFTVPFQNNKREIFLEGEAEFHVTKNKLKPFTVYAGTLETTALGTIFSVKKNNAGKNITVKLFRGKVIIQSINKNLKGWKKDLYLLPGDQMQFNTATTFLTLGKINNIVGSKIINVTKNKQPGTDSLSNELVFNNTKLSLVINKLSSFYNLKIHCDSLLMDTINFTGTVSKHDSLPVILKAIGNMNELDISQNEDGFTISKHQ